MQIFVALLTVVPRVLVKDLTAVRPSSKLPELCTMRLVNVAELPSRVVTVPVAALIVPDVVMPLMFREGPAIKALVVRVLLSVAAPATASVLLRLTAPATVRVELHPTGPARVDTPATLRVPDSVDTPMTLRDPRVHAPAVVSEARVARPATFRVLDRTQGPVMAADVAAVKAPATLSVLPHVTAPVRVLVPETLRVVMLQEVMYAY